MQRRKDATPKIWILNDFRDLLFSPITWCSDRWYILGEWEMTPASVAAEARFKAMYLQRETLDN